MSGIRVAAAGMGDADHLAGLHASAFPEPWSALEFAELLAMQGCFALIAGKKPGSRLGFALCRIAGGECELLTLAVRPEARRQGVATALFEAALIRATAAGAPSFFLEVAEDNAAARGLYARLGFEAVARRPGYYQGRDRRLDALVLRWARQAN